MRIRFAKFTKILLDLMFFGGILLTLTLPWSLRWVGDWFPIYDAYYVPMLIMLLFCSVLAVLIVWELRRIFQTVLADDCFVRRNVISLRRMGCLAWGIAAVVVIRGIIVITPAGIVTFLVFAIAGLFSHVLAQVFDQAVTYKEENDLTI